MKSVYIISCQKPQNVFHVLWKINNETLQCYVEMLSIKLLEKVHELEITDTVSN